MHDSPKRPVLLRGDHLGLAVMITDGVPTLARWNQDLAFTARLGTPGEFHTVEDRQAFFGENARYSRHSSEFALISLENDSFVGFGGLFDITPQLTASMFLAIGDESNRGRGYGRDAARLILRYGFVFRSLYAIKVEVHAFNKPALRTYESVGFRQAGRIRAVNLLDGQRYDEIIMDVIRDEIDLGSGNLVAEILDQDRRRTVPGRTLDRVAGLSNSTA